MPIQTPQWTDFLICPICCNEYDQQHNPVSLGCGHTLCKCCLSKLQRKQCPYDQAIITIDIVDLPTNYALLQLVSSGSFNQSERTEVQSKLQKNVKLSAEEFQLYSNSLKHVEDIALYLKPFSTAVNSPGSVNVLSRPMQRKLAMLINCQLLEEEGRTRALKAARSLGERTVTELIIQHQNPQQLSTNLWAAVRARGCQFLGPAMQEEVLKLVLLALEDGSALSRKVLVMFVVQRLEPHFPQASKTSIGHVVQLLYRASCFVVSKREGDSSLMKLKEEFRTYDSLRREHDAQIVEIATEAGLRIAPDQWSALLYGDTAHKSHMQSIIDKLQNPQSFSQSVQELVIALQRTGDPGNLCTLQPHLEYLANMDVNQDFGRQIWMVICKALEAAYTVVSGLVNFIKTHGCRKTNLDSGNNVTVHASKYKISLCRDFTVNGMCPRGVNCTFAHSEEELVKYRSKHRKYQRTDNEGVLYSKCPNDNNLATSGSNSDTRLEESCRVARKNIPNDKTNCFFCRTHDNSTSEYNERTHMPLNDIIYPSRFIGSHSSAPNNTFKVPSPQYLAAMNQRKQQIISELHQVLSDVQNQQTDGYNFNVDRSSSMTYNHTGSLPNSDYFMNTLLSDENYSSNESYVSPQSGLSLLSSMSFDKTFCGFGNYSTTNDWNSVNLPNSTVGENSQAVKATPDDWNINYSQLCQNCSVTNDASPEENLCEPNHEGLSTDEHESLLLESAKLQDQLRGLKRQITDIKDKTYEEGIVNDLRALEIRLECELAEEEKKLWPLDTKQ